MTANTPAKISRDDLTDGYFGVSSAHWNLIIYRKPWDYEGTQNATWHFTYPDASENWQIIYSAVLTHEGPIRIDPEGWDHFLIVMPHWALVVLFSLPLLWHWYHWKWPKVQPGTCIACGYDLRGSTGDTCPECGEPASDPNGNRR